MSLTQDPRPAAPAGAQRDEIDPRAVADAARRIATDHPSMPVAEIESLLADHLAASTGATVRSFRLLLAERSVRQVLSDRRRRGPVGP